MNVEVLKGKTLTNVLNHDNYELVFICDDGEEYRMYHYQDCCEDVKLDDICGDLEDLIGSEILLAEEISNFELTKEQVEKQKVSEEYGSCTWTFYKLATFKGYVVLRWFGESNGFYSESVDFERIK